MKKSDKEMKVWGFIVILVVVGLVIIFGGLADTASATSEKTTISVTDTSPWFTKGSNSGHPEYWHSYTYSGHTYIWTYVGGMSGNPSQPDCWAEFKPYLSQAGEYEVYACFYADPTQSTQVPYTVYHQSGSTTVRVNQYSNSWWTWREVKLGTWNFPSGANTHVRVIDATGETYDGYTTLNVDTIKFVKINQAPSPPRNLIATLGDGEIDLSWNPPSSDGGSPLTNYKIYRGTSSGGETLYYTTTTTGTTFRNTANLVDGVTYYYKVTAVNSVGESDFSNEASATYHEPSTAPSPPRNLIATLGDGEIDLSWNPPLSDGGSPLTNYKIYRGTSPGGETLYYTTTTTGTTFRNTANLVDGVTYYYKVTAVNSVGESDFSNEASATYHPAGTITLTSPNGGEHWPKSRDREIQWTSSGVTGNVRIELSRNGGSSWETIFSNTANDGSEWWTVTGTDTTQARVRVVNLQNTAISDMSDANFKIFSITATVTSPSSGTNWPAGSTQTITWSMSGDTSNLDYFWVAYSLDGGQSWTNINTATASARSLNWAIPSDLSSTQCKIRVRALDAGGWILTEGVSDTFTIHQAPSKNTISFYTNPSSVGSITFSDTTYTHGQSGKYSSGIYSISANVPSGYDFKSWSTSGEVSVASSTSSSTTATINGDGSLTANFESLPTIEYNRQAAYNYAQKYAYKVCSDGYFFEANYPPSYLGAETPVPSECGFDCAHFVSCCIGAETHEQGGGLDVPSRTEAYGEPGADKLRKWLIDSGNAMYETTIGELEKGDVISYDWDGNGYFDHVVLYLGNGKIAAHSVSYWDVNWDVYKQNHPNFNYKLIHIKGGEQPLTCAIELQKNGIPIDKVNAGQFFDIYVGDSSGSIAQVRFLSDENQNDIVDEGFTWTEWYNWDISSGDWNAETKIMRWSFHTEGRKEVWAEVKDDVDQTTKCSANIITGNLYWLAKAIMSEASIGTQEERIAVGWTVLNRFDGGNFGSSIEDVVKNGYAYNQEPTQEIIALAKNLLERKILDPTGGAMYFFSPISMPKEGEENKCKPPIGNGNMDCSGGLYQVPGTSEKVYFPSWAKPKEGWTVTDFYPTVEDLEWVSGLENVRNWYFMFYRPISSLPLSAHIKVDKTGVCSGDEFTFNGSASTGQIASYKWNFDDGTIVEGSGKPSVEIHRFRGSMNQLKTYHVSLTVQDNIGDTDSTVLDVTVMPLEKTLEVSYHPPIPIPDQPVFARMTVLYNWIIDNEYVVTKIHYESEGFLGVGTISVWDMHSAIWHPIWADNILSWGTNREETYYPKLSTVHYGGDTFEGIVVDVFDAMNIYIEGYAGIEISTGPFIPPPFFKTNSTCFEPDYIQVPDVPIEAPNLDLSHLCSPGVITVYDSQGRVTGLLNGTIKEEIPNSIYDNETKTVLICFSNDSYRYKIIGTDIGTYGLTIISVEDGEANTFAVTNFSTTNKTTHQYSINWSTQEATVQIDSDGDGTFEQNITLQPPVASFTYTPENPTVNQAITFNASSSYDPDGNITNYKWNFGDGTNGSGKITTHSYSSAGEYIITITVTDNSSTINSTSKTVNILNPSPCFIATAAYGTPLHEDIDVLRDFRDEYLMTNPIGRTFVKIYYTASPPIADAIRENEGLRTIVRDGLVKPLVYISRWFVR